MGDWAQGWYEDSVGVLDKDSPFSELYGYVDWDQYAREQEMGEMWFFEESIDITHAFWR